MIRLFASRTHRPAICFAACLLAVAPAATALAAPSGDEYLPKVPKAGGGDDSSGSSAPSYEPSYDPSPSYYGESTETTAASDAGPSKTPEKRTAKPKKRESPVGPVSSSARPSDDGGALFDPVVLLVVGGVFCVATAMIMRRHQVMSLQYRANKHREQLKGARPTPDGEIVGSGEKPL